MRISLLFVVLCSSLSAFAEVTLSEVADALEGAGCWRAGARYEALVPGADDPARYRLELLSEESPGDSLSPCNYLIEWNYTVIGGEESSGGFSAYFNGDYYRFRGGRLMEFHYADDPMPFAPRGSTSDGVQMNDQFATMLPQFMARMFRQMASDTAFVCTVDETPGQVVVKGRELRDGYLRREFVYRFSGATLLPESWETVNNPGQIGEQTIMAEYEPRSGDCPALSEQALIERHPDLFAKYRRDSFSLENLRGEPLPGFTAQMFSGGRYSYRRGGQFATATVIAVLDSKVGQTAGVVEDLRGAVRSLPGACDLIIAFTDNDLDAAGELTGGGRPGETVLVSARALAANCGVADTPSIIFCRADGTVTDIHVGRNNDLQNIVIQKAAMAR